MRQGVSLVYDGEYERSISGVPLDPRRSERMLAFLIEEGLIGEGDVHAPRPVSFRNLLLVHGERYLESVQDAGSVTRILGVPVSDVGLEDVLQLQRLMVGGTIQATRLALINGGIGVNLGGGFHHASANRGMGFCLFNDIAVAIARLRDHGYRERVLVIDLDLHDGNGTRAIFAGDSTVHTYSVHNAHWGETDAVASTSIALGFDVEDEAYLETLHDTLPPLVRDFDPGLVVYVAGADVAADDPIGNWKISPAAILERDRFVFRLCRRRWHAVPVAMVLGGGYGTRAWKYPGRALAFLLARKRIEPPDNDELILKRFRRVLGGMVSGGAGGTAASNGWRLTSDDLGELFPGLMPPTRFLGHFSRQGIELALERLGILRRIRLRGFPNPYLELDLAHPLGHTLRLWASPLRRELLMEMRVNRDTRAISGMEVLNIQWLLLQNPRARFTPDRPPLPGQEHPGLGILKDVLAALVVLCENLGLDGLYYVPSHYHVAAQSRELVRFLHPEHEARFRAMAAALEGMPLVRAARAVEEGRVVDVRTGEPVRWEGFPMVLALSPRLHDQVFSEAYDRRVDEVLAGLELRHVPAGEGARISGSRPPVQ
ncbi:MAG: histone deacetylase [Acidobacteria bacterium]|nr:histone deacetylase [Acidobacteriota bacterium]